MRVQRFCQSLCAAAVALSLSTPAFAVAMPTVSVDELMPGVSRRGHERPVGVRRSSEREKEVRALYQQARKRVRSRMAKKIGTPQDVKTWEQKQIDRARARRGY